MESTQQNLVDYQISVQDNLPRQLIPFNLEVLAEKNILWDLHNINVSKIRHLQFFNFSLLYLNTLITGDDTEHRILFYGHKVTPENFTREKTKRVFSVVEELTDEIPNENVKLFSRLALGGLAMWGMIANPMFTYTLVDHLAITFDNKEFWGKLENGTTVIKIPLRSETEHME